MQFLKNTTTGVILRRTERLDLRKDMAPCDSKGKRVYVGDPEEVISTPIPDAFVEPSAPIEPEKKASLKRAVANNKKSKKSKKD